MSRPAGTVWRWTIGGFGVILGFAGVLVAGRVRDQRFEDARARVGRQLVAVSRGDVARWAPEALQAARAAYESARDRHDAARVPLWPLSDLRAAHRDLRRALVLSSRATSAARVAEQEARGTALEAIENATAAADRNREWLAVLAVPPDLRRSAATAALAVAEARALAESGEYVRAAGRAGDALRLARQVDEQVGLAGARYASTEQVRQWQAAAQQVIAMSRASGGVGLVVWKADHELLVFRAGRLAQRFPADLSYNWIERKRRAGDGAIPEGMYRVRQKKEGAATVYHRALLLDYPNPADVHAFALARRSGEIQPSATIGGLIEIHGEGGLGRDWTRGCVALRNADMDKVFDLVRIGTPVALLGTSRPRDPGDLRGPLPNGAATP